MIVNVGEDGFGIDVCAETEYEEAVIASLNHGGIESAIKLDPWRVIVRPRIPNVVAVSQQATNSAMVPVVPLAIGCPCVGCTPEVGKCRQCVEDHQHQ